MTKELLKQLVTKTDKEIPMWMEEDEEGFKRLNDEIVAKQIADIDSYDPSITALPPMVVDYERSVEEGNKAGSYYEVSEKINGKNFLQKRAGKKEVEILVVGEFSSGEGIAPGVVLAWLEKAGLRPDELPELQAIGENEPDCIGELGPIVALGSPRSDVRNDHEHYFLDPQEAQRPSYPTIALVGDFDLEYPEEEALCLDLISATDLILYSTHQGSCSFAAIRK